MPHLGSIKSQEVLKKDDSTKNDYCILDENIDLGERIIWWQEMILLVGGLKI